VVAEAVEALDRNQFVLSNFPIVTPDGKCSRVWKKEYIYENIQKALIIIDEAQRDYDSVDQKTLNPDEDVFFATSGQNSNEIRIISQQPTRVTKAVRDRMNEWCRVKVYLDIPFLRNREGKLGRPLIFSVTTWVTIEDMNSQNKERIYMREIVLFKKRIALSYDTHFFAKQGDLFNPPTWIEEIKNKGGKIEHLEERINRSRQTRLSPSEVGSIVSSRIKSAISHLNVSLRNLTEKCKNAIQNIHKNHKESLQP
jgi:hypothetical protein